MKEANYNKRDTKKAKEAWLDKVKKNTGQSVDGNNFFIPREVLENALGPYWTKVLDYAIEVGAKNVLAITSKSLRKTAVVKFIQHYLLAHNSWLQLKDLRRTKELSSSELMQAHLDVVKFWATEYNVPWMRDVLTQASGKMYFVRDKRRKDNQEINFGSFDSIAKEGGFTKPFVFHWEELVDPDSKGQAPTRDEFMYVYDLVSAKNEENFMAHGQEIDAFPMHWFTMNRWDKEHPLIEFAEEHVPWEPVKQWMLEDPENNNFFMEYIDKAKEGWEDLDKTLIVHGSKLANHILVKNEKWKQKQLDLIASGDPQKLGTVLGDVFEGTSQADYTYTWDAEDVIFHENLPNTPIAISIGIDKDKNEEIPLTMKSLHKFDTADVIAKFKRPVYSVITQEMEFNPSTKKSWNAEYYYQIIKKQVLSYGSKFIVLLDDDQRLWIDRFNNDQDIKNAKIAFAMAKKHGYWNIDYRVEYGENSIASGFESFLDNPNLRYFINEMKSIKNNPNTGIRDERKGKNKLNKTNSWEYTSFQFAPYAQTFPEGFWEWFYNDKSKES